MGRQRLNPALVEKAGLTSRQVECMEARINGASWRFIAKDLGIDQTVVREHVDKAASRIAGAIDAGYSDHELTVPASETVGAAETKGADRG